MDMVVAMIVGMALGMLVHLVLGLAFGLLIGMFEAMIRSVTTLLLLQARRSYTEILVSGGLAAGADWI
jgi:hypothetical protein